MSPSTELVIALEPDLGERGLDVDVNRLVLTRASATRLLPSLGLESKIVDGRVNNSMREAAGFSLTVLDPHDDLLTSGIFAYNLNAELDDIPFRLVNVGRQEDDTLTLDFEHLLVAFMRQHNDPRKFSRGDFTRAEAARALVREIRAMPVRFVSPDLHKRQPIRKADERKSESERKSNRDPGISESAEIQRPDGRAFTTAELVNAERALDVAASLKAGHKATLALAEACIVEGPFFRNPMGGDASSVGILQLLSGHLGGSTSTHGGRRDIELVCKMFLQDGFTGRGGAIELARAHPDWTAGQVAAEVQGPRADLRGRYDQVKKSAQAVIDAYKGGGDTFGAGGAYYKRYEFTRGQAQKIESSWECTGRWADEVRWRRFVAGRRTFYFISDDQLMRSKSRYLIDAQTVGLVAKPTFDLEVGKRTVVVRGRSIALPSECTIRVRIDRWAAPPGSVIEIADYGPLDGRWLVDEVSRPLYDALAEIHLRQPQKALAEPRSEQATRQPKDSSGTVGMGVSGSVDAVYRAAQKISKRGLPYGAGGHGQKWTQAAQSSSLDCSSSTSLALHAGGMMKGVTGPQVSDWFLGWGEAGEGDTMTVWVKRGAGASGHVFIEFKGYASKRFDTVPAGDGENGPRVRRTGIDYIGARLPDRQSGARRTAAGTARGYVPRHWRGT